MGIRRLTIIWFGVACVVVIAVIYASLAIAGEKTNINVESTRQYLSSERWALQAFVDRLPDIRRKTDLVVNQIHRGCIHAALGAPSNENTLIVTQAVTLRVIASIEKTEMRVTGDFLHDIERLKWRNRAIAQAVSVMRRTFVSQAALMIPDLCTGLQSWHRSGFQRLPRKVVEFVRKAAKLSATPVYLPRLLVQYERGDEHRVLNAIKRLQQLMDHELVAIVTRATDRIQSIISLLPERHESPLPSIAPPAEVKLSGILNDGSRVAVDSGCLACHRIGIQGKAGPGTDLTHIGRTLSETEIRKAIVHANAPMPSFTNLPEAELDKLVKFLSLLR